MQAILSISISISGYHNKLNNIDFCKLAAVAEWIKCAFLSISSIAIVNVNVNYLQNAATMVQEGYSVNVNVNVNLNTEYCLLSIVLEFFA